MKLVVSGGGTGGHVYPALTVVDALLSTPKGGDSLPPIRRRDVLWVGSQGGMEEELVGRAGFQFVGLAAGGLRGMGPWATVRNAARIVASIGPARGILARFGPDAVLVTGGYACASVALAARMKHIPVVIYLPDVVPGLAIRSLSRLATRVAATSEESGKYLDRGKLVATGYPVRREVFALKKDEARHMLALETGSPLLLVLGGSRGARSINRALVGGLQTLLPECQILHISGRLDEEWVAGAAGSLPEALRGRYHHYAYLHETMPAALVAADLAVARSGAATMGEFPAAGLPALLVPYPHSGKHQQANAEHLARHGAARIIPDSELGHLLVPTALEMLRNPVLLTRMEQASRAMARPDAARSIAEEVCSVALRRAGDARGDRS